VGSGVPVLGEEIGFFGLCAQTAQRSERVQIFSTNHKARRFGQRILLFRTPQGIQRGKNVGSKI